MTNSIIEKHDQSCTRYNESDYSRYVNQSMGEREANELEIHAHDCSPCLRGIRLATIARRRVKEQEENDLLFRNALSVMDRLDRNVFTIVVRAVKGVVELVRTTGEQLIMPPALAGARSSAQRGSSMDDGQSMRLVKEFEDSRISVEVTLSPLEPDKLNILVSLLDLKDVDFVPGVHVSCSSDDRAWEGITDNNGQVHFEVPAAGFYELVMKRGNQLLGTMALTGL